MIEAKIDDPESQAGIDFCVKECPYKRCIVLESGVRGLSIKKAERAKRAKSLRASGSSLEEIAKILEVTTRTVGNYLK